MGRLNNIMPNTEMKPSVLLRPQRGVISELFYKGKRVFLPIPNEDTQKTNILFSSGNIDDMPQTITSLSQGMYGTISGKIDGKEAVLDAFRREAKEEFDINITDDQIEDCGLLRDDHVLQLKESGEEYGKIVRGLFSLHILRIVLTDEQYLRLIENYGLFEEEFVNTCHLRPELRYQLEQEMENA